MKKDNLIFTIKAIFYILLKIVGLVLAVSLAGCTNVNIGFNDYYGLFGRIFLVTVCFCLLIIFVIATIGIVFHFVMDISDSIQKRKGTEND
jgi:uncharacterized membrane protein